MKRRARRRSLCDLCRALPVQRPELDFACPACGRRMLELGGPELGGLVLHCPAHCATLIPSPSEIAAAQAQKN